ncbi:MAG: RNA-binding cell elongation regulator Jag/EloR [Candidatus Dormibacteria bacterium]
MNDTDTAIAPAAPIHWPSVEATGSSIETATATALAELGIGVDSAVVEVLARPTEAVLGERVSGGGEARVRVAAVDQYTAHARVRLQELLEKMGIVAQVSVRRANPEPDAPVLPVLDISGDDLGLLIGWRGETLRALQTVINLMMGEGEAQNGRRIIIDVERYRARREDQVKELALRLANRVKRSGQRYTLDPMHAYERRAIHLALDGDEGVTTESSGKEPARRVVILPTGPAQPELPEYPNHRGSPGGSGGRGGDRGGSRGPRRDPW